MRRRNVIFTTALAFILSGTLLAQPRYGDRPRREGGGRNIGRIIADCEQRTNEFRSSFRYASERGYREGMRIDDLNRHAGRLEHVMNAVRDSWERDHDPRRTRRFVNEAINAGQDINRQLMRGRLHPQIERQWSAIRSELNRLAEAFELPPIRW
jgi:hypothetical protein